MRTRIFAAILLCLLMLPFTAHNSEAAGGRWVTVDIDPEVGIPGEMITISATGLDEDEVYEVWAEDDEGQRRFERHNQTTSDGDISWNWAISIATPTGEYDVCVGVHYTAWDNSTSIVTESCVGFDIRARQVNIALRNEVALPGSTVVVDGLLSHPWTGAPMNAPRVEWLALYIIEEDGVQELRDQRSALVEVTGTFDFFFDIPLNIDLDSFGADTVLIQVWANGSGGQESDYASLSLQVGEYSIRWQRPSSLAVLDLDQPLIIEAWTEASANYMRAPLSNQSLSLHITQDDVRLPISFDLNSGTRGHLSRIIESPWAAGFSSGSATLELVSPSPSDGTLVSANLSVWLTSGADPVGMGVELTASVVDGPFDPGDTVTIDVLVSDETGNPLPFAWVHWVVDETDDGSYYYYGGPVTASPNAPLQMGDDGRAELSLRISADFRADLADLTVSLLAHNGSGDTDSEVLEIPVNEPEIHAVADSAVYMPGSSFEVELSAVGFTNDVIWTWDSSDGQSGIIRNDGLTNSFTLTVRESFSGGYLRVDVEAIDAAGHSASDTATLVELGGHTLTLSIPSGRVKAGDTVQVDYQVATAVSGDQLELPMIYNTMVLGSPETARTGVVASASGSLPVDIPDNLKAGQYILQVNVGGASSLQVFEVVDSDSNDIATATGDVVKSASPTLSVIALIVGLFAVMLALLRGRGGGGGGDADAWATENAAPPPTAQPVQAAPPPAAMPSQNISTTGPPPADAQPATHLSMEQMAHPGPPPPPTV